jgi:putative endonuclease
MMIDYWVYILTCENKSFYTGYTTNLERRYQEHITGTGRCKYTRAFKPTGIAQSWKISGNKSTAMRIERLIKKMTKHKKEELIIQPELFDQVFDSILKD